MKKIHVFPFYSNTDTTLTPDFDLNLTKDRIILRGSELEKNETSIILPIYLNSKKVEADVVFWRYSTQKGDFLKKYEILCKDGLGF